MLIVRTVNYIETQLMEIEMGSPDYSKIAASYSLWGEYFDTGAETTEAEFNAMSQAEKVGMLIEAFGPEKIAE